MKDIKQQEICVVDGVHMHLENKHLSRACFWFICALYVCVCMTKNCFSAAMASIVSEGIFTKSQTGFITSMFFVVYTPLQIVGGIMSDKCNPERLIKIGLIGSAVINTIIFFNQNYYVMLSVWMINAVFQAPMWSCVFKIMSSQLVRSDREMMNFYMSFATSIGFIVSFLIAAFVKKWQDNFAVSAVILITLAIIIHFGYKYVEPYMKPDRQEKSGNANELHPASKMGSVKLFLFTGLFAMFFVSILRNSLDQGIKTLSSIMLVESYENVSPVLGNLIGSIIISAGILGSLLGKKIMVSRIGHNPLKGHVILLLAAIPFLFAVTLIGRIPIYAVIAATFIVVMLTSATNLLNSSYNMSFVKYGKNGAAAGICNAGAAIGVIVYSSLYTVVAEKFNWQTVAVLFIVVIFASAMFSLIAYLQNRNFEKKNI